MNFSFVVANGNQSHSSASTTLPSMKAEQNSPCGGATSTVSAGATTSAETPSGSTVSLAPTSPSPTSVSAASASTVSATRPSGVVASRAEAFTDVPHSNEKTQCKETVGYKYIDDDSSSRNETNSVGAHSVITSLSSPRSKEQHQGLEILDEGTYSDIISHQKGGDSRKVRPRVRQGHAPQPPMMARAARELKNSEDFHGADTGADSEMDSVGSVTVGAVAIAGIKRAAENILDPESVPSGDILSTSLAPNVPAAVATSRGQRPSEVAPAIVAHLVPDGDEIERQLQRLDDERQLQIIVSAVPITESSGYPAANDIHTNTKIMGLSKRTFKFLIAVVVMITAAGVTGGVAWWSQNNKGPDEVQTNKGADEVPTFSPTLPAMEKVWILIGEAIDEDGGSWNTDPNSTQHNELKQNKRE